MHEKAASALATQFHDVYEKLAPSFGYETRQDTKTFDPNTANGRLMIATCQELINTGLLLLPIADHGLMLTAVVDGRRSKKSYPDKIQGWQFLGHIDPSGKPTGAPRWVAERVKRPSVSDVVYFKPTISICNQALHIGDWIIRDMPNDGQNYIRILTAAEVARWYRYTPAD